MIIFYFAYGKKHGGIDLKSRGVLISARNLWKTVLLAITVAAASYGLVFFADYFFKTDFRLWVVALKAFTPDKVSIILRYLPFFLVFYLINSVAVNCFNYVTMGKKEWVNVALLALFNVLGALVIVIVQYTYFYITGHSFYYVFFNNLSNIGSIWLFPMLVILPLAPLCRGLSIRKQIIPI